MKHSESKAEKKLFINLFNIPLKLLAIRGGREGERGAVSLVKKIMERLSPH